MQATAQQLAERVGATLEGVPDIVVQDARSLLQATADHLSFIESEKRRPELAQTQARVVIAPLDFTLPEAFLNRAGVAILRVREPLPAFLELVAYLREANVPHTPGIDPQAVVDPSVRLGTDCVVRSFAHIGAGTILGARCVIHPNTVIGRNCVLGDDVILHPNVVLYDGTRIGHRSIIHSGSVMGADGFGYRFARGRHNKIPQLGWVEIGEDVEIGAGVTIDRGMVDPTVIGSGTKIDNQVQIGHNCIIGEHNMLVSQVGISGSCTTGKYVTMAGQVGVADHLHIGDGASIGAQAGVARNVPAGRRVWGSPALDESEIMKVVVCLPRLPQMWRDLNAIRRLLGMEDPSKKAA